MHDGDDSKAARSENCGSLYVCHYVPLLCSQMKFDSFNVTLPATSKISQGFLTYCFEKIGIFSQAILEVFS